MILQAHWQFKNNTFEKKSQLTLPDSLSRQEKTQLINNWLDTVKKEHPLPENTVWMVCNEHAKQFVKTQYCKICKRQLDNPDDPLSENHGGDCLKCMAQAGDPECKTKIRNILN